MIKAGCAAELPDDVLALIRAEFDLRHVDWRDEAAVGEALRGASALIVAPGVRVDACRIAALPESVVLLASYSAGLDHVDLQAAAARGLTVTNTPGELTDATADVAMLLILAVVRGTSGAERVLRDGAWGGWTPKLVFGRDVTKLTLGIVGPGRIGWATAKRAAAFGMRIAYWGRTRADLFEAHGAEFCDTLPALFSVSDVISLHVPATPETRGMIDRRAIDQMRRGSYIVNTARGDLIDDAALIEALHDGRISGAGLDVFKDEPALNPAYLDAPNVTLLPHIGSATRETRLAMGQSVLRSLKQHLRS